MQQMLRQAPPALVAAFASAYTFPYVVRWVDNGAGQLAGAAAVVHFLSLDPFVRFLWFLPLAGLLMIPSVWMACGRYPTQEDVDLSRALRRAAGLPDSVSDDTDI